MTDFAERTKIEPGGVRCFPAAMKLIIVCGFLILLLSGCLNQSPCRCQKETSVSSKQAITRVIINGRPVNVELAVNREEWFRGLSNRKSLAADQGMLFIYPNYAVRSYWMNEMQFPLDIIWIKDDQVVGVEQSVSTTIPRTTYHSPEPVNYVLEVNAGWTKTSPVATGDRVEFR